MKPSKEKILFDFINEISVRCNGHLELKTTASRLGPIHLLRTVLQEIEEDFETGVPAVTRRRLKTKRDAK
jgi:hypothetical protein